MSKKCTITININGTPFEIEESILETGSLDDAIKLLFLNEDFKDSLSNIKDTYPTFIKGDDLIDSIKDGLQGNYTLTEYSNLVNNVTNSKNISLLMDALQGSNTNLFDNNVFVGENVETEIIRTKNRNFYIFNEKDLRKPGKLQNLLLYLYVESEIYHNNKGITDLLNIISDNEIYSNDIIYDLFFNKEYIEKLKSTNVNNSNYFDLIMQPIFEHIQSDLDVNYDDFFELDSKQYISVEQNMTYVEKIEKGLKTTLLRTKGDYNKLNLRKGKSKVEMLGGKPYNITNLGLHTVDTAGGKDVMLKNEGYESISSIQNKIIKNWFEGKSQMYLYKIEPANVEIINSNIIKENQISKEEHKKKLNSKVNFEGIMSYSFNGNAIKGVKVDNTFDAVKQGLRTATTRYDDNKAFNYWKRVKIGDIVKFKKSKDSNEYVLVKITKPLTKLNIETDEDVNSWSTKELWNTKYFDNVVRPKLDKAYQMEFELYIEPESFHFERNGNVTTISYKDESININKQLKSYKDLFNYVYPNMTSTQMKRAIKILNEGVDERRLINLFNDIKCKG